MQERIIRLPEAKSLCGLSRSTIYLRIREGLFPNPIPLGPRMVGWQESEVVALNAARVRGVSDDDVRSLVLKLEAARKNATGGKA